VLSSLFFCHAADAGYMPLSSGYLLFSALSKHLGASTAGELLHTWDEGQFFTLSSIMPDYFWKTFRCSSQDGNILFEKGALFAFRASFPDVPVFDDFASSVVGASLTLGSAAFKILKASQIGENDMSRRMDFDDLTLIPPFPEVAVDFILPTGFKSNERQMIFPVPELFFGSLAIRWQKGTKTETPFDKNLFNRVSVESYSLSSAATSLKNNQVFRGCVGSARYSFKKLSEAERAFLSRLASLAPFCGVGYKVAQGMGLVKVQF
jgi:CRISPR-associated endoribonuclease Cas6